MQKNIRHNRSFGSGTGVKGSPLASSKMQFWYNLLYQFGFHIAITFISGYNSAMAHIEKYTRNGTANLFAHFDRTLSNNSNKDIDPARTHLNYNLAPKGLTQNEILKNRLEQVKVLKRKDVNVLCSWVVTLPKDFKGNEEDFFKATYDFLEAKYGRKNVVSAYVHKDEAQPHLHFAFVPVVLDKKKNIEKVSAKECVTKNDLMTFHGELQRHLEKVLGENVHVLNGATVAGNLTVRELKISEKEKELESREKSLSDAKNGLLERSKALVEQETRLDEKKAFLDGLERSAEDFVSSLESPKPLEDFSSMAALSTPARLEWNFKPRDKAFSKEPRAEYAHRMVKTVWEFAQKKVDLAIKKFNKAKVACRSLAEALRAKSAELGRTKTRLDRWERMTPEELTDTARIISGTNARNWNEYEQMLAKQQQSKRTFRKRDSGWER